MGTPAPLVIPWRGRSVHVRHDDPRLGPHTPRAAVIISAAQLASSPAGLRLVLQATVGEWYAVRVREEPLMIGLRRVRGRAAPDGRPEPAEPDTRGTLGPGGSGRAEPLDDRVPGVGQ
jgi:hypothetical protein